MALRCSKTAQKAAKPSKTTNTKAKSKKTAKTQKKTSQKKKEDVYLIDLTWGTAKVPRRR